MARVHFNNFRTTLNGSLTNVATSITLNTSIPSLSGGTVYLTLYGGGVYEIISIASNAGAPTYTCVRGLEGTTAVAWADGSKVECRVTRDSIDTKQDLLSGASLTTATVATDDKIIIQDTSNSDNIKTVTTQAVANLFLPSFVFITSHAASNSATLDFTSLGDYSYVEFVLVDLIPQTDAQAMTIRTSTNNGSSYDSGASDYSYASNGESSTPASVPDGSSGATYIKCNASVGNATNEKCSGYIKMFNPTGTGFCMFVGQVASLDFSTLTNVTSVAGTRRSAADVDAVRFMFASGNIVSGTIYAYGIKKT